MSNTPRFTSGNFGKLAFHHLNDEFELSDQLRVDVPKNKRSIDELIRQLKKYRLSEVSMIVRSSTPMPGFVNRWRYILAFSYYQTQTDLPEHPETADMSEYGEVEQPNSMLFSAINLHEDKNNGQIVGTGTILDAVPNVTLEVMPIRDGFPVRAWFDRVGFDASNPHGGDAGEEIVRFSEPNPIKVTCA